MDGLPLYVGMVQVYTDKTTWSPKANDTVVISVHLVLLIVSKTFCRFFTDHGHTLNSLLPVATSETSIETENSDAALKRSNLFLSAGVPFFDELPVTSLREAKEMKLKVLYAAVHKLPGSMN